MTRAHGLAVMVCMGACAPPPRARVQASAPPSRAPSALAAPTGTGMVPAHGPRDEPIPGPPNGASLELATTPDGSAAITTDSDGALRLWPTLDGHREPRAVPIASPVHAISIVRSGAGFLVASIDDSRDLTLTQLDADGHAIAHRELGGDPAVIGTTAFDGGVLAWASDQTIAWFGADGTTRGRLATLPGERVLQIAARGEHVIALVDSAAATPRHRVRALSIPGTAAGSGAPTALAWGAVLSGTYDVAGPIAVSPSGNRIAFGRDGAIDAIAAGTSQLVMSFVLPGGPTAFAFFDDDHLAISSQAALITWIDGKAQLVPPNAENVRPSVPMAAPGPGAIAVLTPGGPALATPSADRSLTYLGYGLVSPSLIAAGGSDMAAIANPRGLAMLVDDDLREHGHFDLRVGSDESPPASLAWLGGDDWLVASAQLHVVSAAGAPAIALDAPPEGASFVRAEPSAHLAATAYGLTAALLRWDPTRRAMNPVAHLDLASPYGMIAFAPTDPALANGVHVVRADQRETAEVQWYADDEMKKVTASARVAAVLAVDATARVYAWTLGEPAHIAILAKGAEVGQVGASTAALFPEPNGAHVAALTDTAVELYDGATLVWSRELARPHQIAWLGDGALAVLTDHCVSRLDVATGAIAAHRCGWGFGLWPSALDEADGLN